MAIKISDKEILVYCNICGKTVYKADRVSHPFNISDFYPTIQETYKVYCEKCYMAPIKKIEELETQIERLKQKVAIRQKRVKKRVDKQIKELERINNEFY